MTLTFELVESHSANATRFILARHLDPSSATDSASMEDRVGPFLLLSAAESPSGSSRAREELVLMQKLRTACSIQRPLEDSL